MKKVAVVRAGGPGAFPAMTEAAALLAFPQGEWMEVPGLESLPPPEAPPGLGILLIDDTADASGTPTAVSAYQNLRDADGLPCWIAVKFGSAPDAIPAADWSTGQLSHFLKATLDRLTDQREVARLRGEMLTVARRISHDLRTALGGILSTVDVLAETVPASRSVTGPLFASVDEMTHLISRTGFLLKAIAMPLPAAPVKMASAVATAQSRLESLAARQGAMITLPDAWPEVLGLTAWAETIWWNLLHNALRFSPAPVRLIFAWERLPGLVKFSVRPQDSTTSATPPMHGIRPFHQLHDPNAGKGLGLAIVRRLAELQGGTSGFEPDGQGGGYFYFTLPEAPAPR
ncbi:MAG: histidine kinase [Verrucomicrobiales bacterium]|nr:histidine kinase [Verrucomicrobiales bacterium]